jgi:hypothetical protein
MTLKNKVLAFFKANPDEELFYRDIAEKFGYQPETIRRQLKGAVDMELLSAEETPASHGKTAGLMYRAGKHIEQAVIPAEPEKPKTPIWPVVKQTLPAAPAPTKRGPGRPDLSGLVVRTGVPVPGRIPARRGGSIWDELFSLLTGPDQSVGIPADWTQAVRAHCTRANKRLRAAGVQEMYIVRKEYGHYGPSLFRVKG